MFACCLLMYSTMGYSPAASSASITGGYHHSLPAPHIVVIPVIRLSGRWWNPYRTFSITPGTTQLSLPYSITTQYTALYIMPRARTVATVFANNLAITPHHIYGFFRF